MKHNSKITTILITMFIVTQLIGLFIISTYQIIPLPYGMEPPEEIKDQPQGPSIIIAFIIAITLFMILIKFNLSTFIRLWFFIVTTLALGLALTAIIFSLNITTYYSLLALIIALPLAYIKIFKRHLITHNLTELLIYPGIAAVFIPLLNTIWIIIILLLISLYDIWAVWHSSFMEKMARYQIENLKFFTGFFIPYANKNQRKKIKQLKQKYKNNDKELEKHFKKSKIKVNLAILGGGDVIFPIITAGVFMIAYNSIIPALIISATATLSLLYLFILAKKGKFYPAMPFLTIGMYLGMIFYWLVF
ncbi:hypothetical protein CMI38_01450 [Candidatus Pacearchaeota archaeon]|nr:hypothetical protein [Candidatus Pacearchaeota archaeon]|tara:strand:+ start:24281 stop:25195 length:915 start_codon:yes stop_codon:yes gene_type:complete